MTVYVTLGKNNEFGIDSDDDMFIGRCSEPGSRVYLGKATVQNFNRLKQNMERLQIHMHHDSSERKYKP